MIEADNENLEKVPKLLKKAEALSPQFKTNEEAIRFYTMEIEKFCSKYNKPIEELLIWADEEPIFIDDLSYLKMLQRKLQVLRQI